MLQVTAAQLDKLAARAEGATVDEKAYALAQMVRALDKFVMCTFLQISLSMALSLLSALMSLSAVSTRVMVHRTSFLAYR